LPGSLRPRSSASPLVVALIGPAGAGKSALRQALVQRGAASLDFDEYSRELLRPGTAEYERLQQEFGPGVLEEDGSVNRAVLGALVFSDVRARRRLNAIVHPGMLARLRRTLVEFRRRPTAPLLVVEGAILGQLPTQGWFDRVVMMDAPPELRARRLREGKGLSEEAAARLIRLHERMGVGRERADCVVSNEGDRSALEAQADELWKKLTNGDRERTG
jgi:dephospho-CoA kinase